MASVRAIIPGQIKDETLFQPLTTIFERYPAERVEIIIGAAGKVDTDGKSVVVSLPGSSSRTLTYDQLVVATGARSPSSAVPWKILDSYDETVSNLDSTRERVQAAKHIVVAGAGATGVEVAGELGYEFGKTKEIILLSGGSSLLDGDSLGPGAKSELEKLNVKIRLDARVTGSKDLPDGKTEVTLKEGETITTDLYLPTIGMRPNSEMLEGKFLNEKGYVVVDAQYRVKGLEEQGVWALGDVVSTPKAGWVITQKQVSFFFVVVSFSSSEVLVTNVVTIGRRCRQERAISPPGEAARSGEADPF